MVKEIRYIAQDGKKFETERECLEHESAVKRNEIENMQKTMCELDEKIWNKYYPQDSTEEKPGLHTAYIWLRNDIVHILADNDIDTMEAEKEILAMIKETKYSKEILTEYIKWGSIKNEVEIRVDYQAAFKKVKSGSSLSHEINYTLGKNDLKQLAKLHKSNRCRKKIEDLLTDCNFHYECSKFANREYEEFLQD